MTSPAQAGGTYQYQDQRPAADNIPDRPLPKDPGFQRDVNPDGSEIGPIYLSPDASRWINQNVTDQGYVVDWGTREIIDPNDGSVKGRVPTTVPRMV